MARVYWIRSQSLVMNFLVPMWCSAWVGRSNSPELFHRWIALAEFAFNVNNFLNGIIQSAEATLLKFILSNEFAKRFAPARHYFLHYSVLEANFAVLKSVMKERKHEVRSGSLYLSFDGRMVKQGLSYESFDYTPDGKLLLTVLKELNALGVTIPYSEFGRRVLFSSDLNLPLYPRA